MKILCCGDQHITNKSPKNRTDDYFKTVLWKFEQELQIAEEEDCQFIIMPGDVFDTFKESHLVVQKIMSLIELHDARIICCAGQHDQQFHNTNLEGTALGTLIAAGSVIYVDGDEAYHESGVCFYGASWKSEVPVIKNPDLFNVLITHKMIVDEKLWAQQEGHIWANQFLQRNNFDLIVSGDNHSGFLVQKGGKTLINCGSMMRSTIAQVNHHPAVGVYNTRDKSMQWIDLVVRPFNEVMSLDKAEKEKEKNEQLDTFISSLKTASGSTNIKLSFVDRLNNFMDENHIDDSVKDIIYEAMES